MVQYRIQQYTVYNIGYSGENSFVVYSFHSGYVFFFMILYKPVRRPSGLVGKLHIP